MIKASYEDMQSAANNITKAAEEYKANVDNLYQIVDNLVNNWKGSDNVRFAETVNGYKEDLKALGDIVNSYATFLNNSARTINETQESVSSAASRL